MQILAFDKLEKMDQLPSGLINELVTMVKNCDFMIKCWGGGIHCYTLKMDWSHAPYNIDSNTGLKEKVKQM